MNSIEKLMSYLDDKKIEFKEGTYITICNYMMDIKNEQTELKKQITRYKRKIFQKTMISTCLLDHITETEYHSDEDDVEIYLQWGAMP